MAAPSCDGPILVVEDNEDSREMLADLLGSHGYAVETAVPTLGTHDHETSMRLPIARRIESYTGSRRGLGTRSEGDDLRLIDGNPTAREHALSERRDETASED